MTDEQIKNLQKENVKLRQAVRTLINVSGLNGNPVSVKKVQEAVDLAKKALKQTKDNA